MSIMKEFKEFVMRDDVIDMAVGIVIGLAIGKVVASFVADVLMPPLGLLLGDVNFADLAITLKEASGEVAAVTLPAKRYWPLAGSRKPRYLTLAESARMGRERSATSRARRRRGIRRSALWSPAPIAMCAIP